MPRNVDDAPYSTEHYKTMNFILSLFYCQMTMSGIRLVSGQTGALNAEWKPSDGKNINVVAANNNQAVCSCGKQLYYFEMGNSSLNMCR